MISDTNRVWLVDDDPDDQYLFTQALHSREPAPDCECFLSAEDMLKSLNASDSINPDLIVLDLNMPGMDGMQALVQLKQTDHTCHIPVVIYTTSQSDLDIADCYRLGANSLMVKPGSYSELVQKIQQLCDYWFSVVRLHRE